MMFGRLKVINKLKSEIKILETEVKNLKLELKQEKDKNAMLYKLAEGFDRVRKEGKNHG